MSKIKQMEDLDRFPSPIASYKDYYTLIILCTFAFLLLQISRNCIKIHLLINNTGTLPHSIQLTPSIILNQNLTSFLTHNSEKSISFPDCSFENNERTVIKGYSRKPGTAQELRENCGSGSDVEQLRINRFAGEIQLRTNSRQDEQSNRNECAPYSSNRMEKRESTACSIYQPLSNPLQPSPGRSICSFFFQECKSAHVRFSLRIGSEEGNAT